MIISLDNGERALVLRSVKDDIRVREDRLSDGLADDEMRERSELTALRRAAKELELAQ